MKLQVQVETLSHSVGWSFDPVLYYIKRAQRWWQDETVDIQQKLFKICGCPLITRNTSVQEAFKHLFFFFTLLWSATSSWNFLHALRQRESLFYASIKKSAKHKAAQLPLSDKHRVSKWKWPQKIETKRRKKNSDKFQKALLPNSGAATATSDDVCEAHLCGYTDSLPSTIIATKSCSDADVWEISWWFIYCHFCLFWQTHVSVDTHRGIKHLSANCSQGLEDTHARFPCGFVIFICLGLFFFFFSLPPLSL